MSDIILCSKDACTGCFACQGICPKHAISQVKDDEGFRHPEINKEVCIACHLCERVCPVLNPIKKNLKGDVYAAWSLDENIRTKSSSGGIFSELAICVLRQGGVVVGASMDNNGYVHHTIISDINELNSHRGSKYVQSMIDGDVYRELRKILLDGRKVLFTGCPCQVAGARSIFKDDENLYTVDIVCHGVPSPEAFAKVYYEIKCQYPNLVSYNFRKLDSWGVCSSVNININNILTNLPLTGKLTFYQDAFLKGLMHRPNCYSCNYATIERVGDVTLADFWGVGSYKPISDNHKGGCSMLSVNSVKGKMLFNEIKERIYFDERDIQETIQGGNEQIVRASAIPEMRNTFYVDLYSHSIEQLISKYGLKTIEPVSLVHQVVNLVKNKILRILR